MNKCKYDFQIIVKYTTFFALTFHMFSKIIDILSFNASAYAF